MSPIVSRCRRNDPAGWIERSPGVPSSKVMMLLMASSAFGSSIRFVLVSSAAIPARICCSVRSERPLSDRRVPASAACRRSSIVSTWSSS
jgi:hypothetical protein